MDQLRGFLESLPLACLVVDDRGCITFANTASEPLFGYAREELQGQSVLTLVPEQSRSRVPLPGSPASPSGWPRLPKRTLTVLALRKDGSECPVEVDLAPLATEAGPAVAALVRDVSGQLLDRERMLLHLSDLAHASRLSTMGEMVAGLAHELNQPLYAVSNYAQACRELVRGHPDVEARLAAITDRLTEQTERAAEIVRRLRRFVSRRMPQRAALDVNALVRDVDQLMLFHAHRFAIATDLRLSPGLPQVMGDSILIEQIMVNLLRNAFEAVSEWHAADGLVIVETELDRTGRIAVSVIDNGPGFGVVTCEQLFEPFYTTKEQGMGMGLVISRSIAEAHGGSLTAERRARGAVFRLCLPAIQEESNDGTDGVSGR
jgi:two-component system sensor kinase FixL